MILLFLHECLQPDSNDLLDPNTAGRDRRRQPPWGIALLWAKTKSSEIHLAIKAIVDFAPVKKTAGGYLQLYSLD